MFGRPEYRWVGTSDPFGGVVTAIARTLAWLGALQRQHPAASHALVIALEAVVAVLLVHLVYVLWSVTRPSVRTPGPANVALGAELDTSQAHRDRADALARMGRFTEALSHRFLAVVLELDRHHVLTFRESKTPAEYLGEAGLDDSSRRFLSDLVARLYRHVFGAVPCGAREYGEFVAAAATLER